MAPACPNFLTGLRERGKKGKRNVYSYELEMQSFFSLFICFLAFEPPPCIWIR